MKILLACALALCALSMPMQADAGSFWTSKPYNVSSDPVPPGMTLKRLVKLTSDRDSDITLLSTMIDANHQITGFYGAISTGAADEGEGWDIPDGNKNVLADPKRNVFPLSEVESDQGSVLAVVKGRNALILQGALDRTTQEGHFVIRYLANGLWGRYESCDFYLRKHNDNWYIQNAYTQKRVTDVKVITYSLGITTLEGLCPAK